MNEVIERQDPHRLVEAANCEMLISGHFVHGVGMHLMVHAWAHEEWDLVHGHRYFKALVKACFHPLLSTNRCAR